jgi:hypothetical protein
MSIYVVICPSMSFLPDCTDGKVAGMLSEFTTLDAAVEFGREIQKKRYAAQLYSSHKSLTEYLPIFKVLQDTSGTMTLQRIGSLTRWKGGPRFRVADFMYDYEEQIAFILKASPILKERMLLKPRVTG